MIINDHECEKLTLKKVLFLKNKQEKTDQKCTLNNTSHREKNQSTQKMQTEMYHEENSVSVHTHTASNTVEPPF